METTMNGFRNSGLWHADCNVFMCANFPHSMVTHGSQAAKAATPTQTPGYNAYISVEKISPLPSNSAECLRPKSRKKYTESGMV